MSELAVLFSYYSAISPANKKTRSRHSLVNAGKVYSNRVAGFVALAPRPERSRKTLRRFRFSESRNIGFEYYSKFVFLVSPVMAMVHSARLKRIGRFAQGLA